MKLKIAIVVHGRFHAFDLARGLIARGHDVTVFTNYPKTIAEGFGLPKQQVRSFWIHGGVSRAAWRLSQKNIVPYPEAWLHTMFGKWAIGQLEKESWDVVHIWSGVSEEILQGLAGSASLTLIMRGSAHIQTQARLLEEEERRTGIAQDRPSRWMIAREQREYEGADLIVTLSTFAYESFIAEGISASKLERIPLGASVHSFRPTREVVEARCRSILSGQPLRVLYVGAFSFQKGLHDLATIARKLSGSDFSFRFIGPSVAETKPLLRELRQLAEIVPKRPQRELPLWYASADLFVFPTIQDGYASVVAQAHASALPILTTTNCGGPDLIQNGETGWILPIRSPEAFIKRLRWCDAHRKELAEMVRRVYLEYRPRDWNDVAADFEAVCASQLNGHRRSGFSGKDSQ